MPDDRLMNPSKKDAIKWSTFCWLPLAQLSHSNAADQKKVNDAREKLEALANCAGNWGPWQFWSLIVGAAPYVGWHLLELYLRAPK
jgi:hypothetical protein